MQEIKVVVVAVEEGDWLKLELWHPSSLMGADF